MTGVQTCALPISGLELVELAESDTCCGSAGSYNLTEAAMARRLAERKVANIRATGATCVAVANPGCILQIQAGLHRAGLSTRVAHPIELLDQAYQRPRGTGEGASPTLDSPFVHAV